MNQTEADAKLGAGGTDAKRRSRAKSPKAGGAQPVGVWLHRLPRRWARARLASGIDGVIASQSLTAAANLLPLLLAWLLLVAQVPEGGDQNPAVLQMLPALPAWWALQTGLRRWLTPLPPARTPRARGVGRAAFGSVAIARRGQALLRGPR